MNTSASTSTPGSRLLLGLAVLVIVLAACGAGASSDLPANGNAGSTGGLPSLPNGRSDTPSVPGASAAQPVLPSGGHAEPALPTQGETGDTIQFATPTTEPPRTNSTVPPTTTTTTAPTTTSAPPTTLALLVPVPVRCTLSGDEYFESDSSIPSPTAAARMSALFAPLTDIQSVRVEGHTDWRNSDAYNLALSQARADQVAAIVRLLVPGTVTISAVGLGEADAHQNSPTDAEMASDRRVDLFIVATFPPGASC